MVRRLSHYAPEPWRYGIVMLGAISLRAVLTGVAAGSLVAAVIYLFGFVLAPAAAGELVLLISLLGGLIGGGWMAGRLTPFNGRFNGSVCGLGIAAVVVVVARLGGSPAPSSQVLILAVLAIVVGGGAGWWGGRRRYNGHSEPAGRPRHPAGVEESPDSAGQDAG